MTVESVFEWPGEGVSRVPFRVYSDPGIYEAEQDRIFRGPVWHFVMMDREIPEPGDYRRARIGDTPIVAVRDAGGGINAMVNRCVHRGNLVCIDEAGRADGRLTCVYHNWTYDLSGRLTSVAFQKGAGGKGGMPEDFDLSAHRMTPLRVAVYRGLVFVTLSDDTPPLEDYLGPEMCANIDRVVGRDMVILGTYTQSMANNWKLYMENVRDSYHASLLHLFFTATRINRLSMDGGIRLSDRGWHHISYSIAATDREEPEYDPEKLRAADDDYDIADPRIVRGWPEFECGTTLAIQSVFPNFVLQQTLNSIALRICAPTGPDSCELSWRILGCAEDSEAERAARVHQSNLIGPAGLISMEDGIVGSWVRQGIRRDPGKSSLVEMGGRDVVPSPGSRATEVSVRGFWRGWRDLMDI